MRNPGLYIHIPFCRNKCPYCSFFSVGSNSLLPEYLKAMKEEIRLYKDSFTPFDTIYMGGGTPTLLGLEDLEVILDCLQKYLRISNDPETTIEANPGDITYEKAKGLKILGFNRINLGVQSFNDNDLCFLGRMHTAADAENAFKILREAGFENIGIDLIYGFEGQSIGRWLKTLEKSVLLRPEHISCYQLTFEKKTPFLQMLEKGEINGIDEDQESIFFLKTSSYLEDSGYLHYEVSNFSIDEAHCSRHNTKYWEHVPYLGLGPSSHSFHNSKRWWNINSVRKYCKILGTGILPIEGEEVLTDEQVSLELITLGLRTRKGIDPGKLHDDPETLRSISNLKDSGHLKVINDRLVPTKKGFLISDRLPLLILH